MLVSTSANAAYAEPGYLVYLRDKTLVAQSFDRRRYVLSGEPHTLSDEVLYTSSCGQGCFQRLRRGGSGHPNGKRRVPFAVDVV